MSVATRAGSGQKNWSPTYYVILVLSLILIPISTFFGYINLNVMYFTVNGEPIFGNIDLPALAKFYYDLNQPGLVKVASVIEAVIVLQFFMRRHLLSVIISALGIIISLVFMAACQLSVLLPFIKMAPFC